MDELIETLTDQLKELRISRDNSLPDFHLYFYYEGKIHGIEFVFRSLGLLKNQ